MVVSLNRGLGLRHLSVSPFYIHFWFPADSYIVTEPRLGYLTEELRGDYLWVPWHRCVLYSQTFSSYSRTTFTWRSGQLHFLWESVGKHPLKCSTTPGYNPSTSVLVTPYIMIGLDCVNRGKPLLSRPTSYIIVITFPNSFLFIILIFSYLIKTRM